ncbi:hypothetical protein HID58_005281 [Brassica napus]|uniref:non-specific serine/threonine protein kinase n=1 Tax=Brassica napus TaxID=3708 RepID=A0ABQ8E865_BRANA|nr:hypothetical protein HID58_005281 [Brassica napus]
MWKKNHYEDYLKNNHKHDHIFGTTLILQDGTEVAVKHLKDGSRQGEREFQAEIQFISRVHHRNSHIGYCVTGSPRLLVYEFLPNKTLELFML